MNMELIESVCRELCGYIIWAVAYDRVSYGIVYRDIGNTLVSLTYFKGSLISHKLHSKNEGNLYVGTLTPSFLLTNTTTNRIER